MLTYFSKHLAFSFHCNFLFFFYTKIANLLNLSVCKYLQSKVIYLYLYTKYGKLLVSCSEIDMSESQI